MATNESSMLKLVDLKKEYIVSSERVLALKGVSLDFKAGEFVSILGPSGCGKTTMLNLIGGLDKYTSGDLVINGTSTKNFSDSDWDAYRNNSIGFVFQSYNLIPHLTILGNVELALTLSGVSRSERIKRATEALTKVGLEGHINKRPNQLSGGQMQRVAIARALINNPDIILADEPTGALDSETSVQIMELLKEVAKDKLVIMVTHNPELAMEYSTRICKFKDGQLVEDSNPFKETTKEDNNFKPKKTAMPFKMALSLSFKNLLSKKARTLITAFAGSIGIFGIACVLALSTGFQGYVDKMQNQLTTEYPLKITSTTFDMDKAFGALGELGQLKPFPDSDFVTGNDFDMAAAMHTNKFTPEFLTYIKGLDPELYNELLITYKLNLNVFTKNNIGGYQKVDTFDPDIMFMHEMMGMASHPWGQLLDNDDFLLSQYDVIYGNLPTNKNQVVLFVDEYNRIDKETLENLGLYGNTINFSEIVGHEFSLLTNDLMYRDTGVFTQWTGNSLTTSAYESGLKLEIVGIVRVSEDAAASSLECTIGYTKELTDYLIEYETSETTKSAIVKYVEANPGYNPFTKTLNLNPMVKYDAEFFGASETPYSFSFYERTLESKSEIKGLINAYNDLLTEQQVKDGYTIKIFDNVEMMVGSMNIMISAISSILIAFTSISLVVSSVMIGIITYVSVIERTKEIGVLRSIGARKKDISRVFNAETLIIGFTAGAIAISFVYILSLPVNAIVFNILEIKNIMSLHPVAAVILITISISLTMFAGLIPSKIAAKKDPVTALRSE